MQVAVVGGGVIGVSTAYFLAAAGHEVAVVERCSNVAEEGSFGNSGLVAPALATPWGRPGMPRRIMSTLFHREAPLVLRRRVDPVLWRWAQRWTDECELDRFVTNTARLQRLGFYSRQLLEQLRLHYHLEYEQTGGHLQLLRTDRECALVQPGLALLREHGVAHAMLDPAAARLIEPALALNTPLAGALHLPHDEAGNCALFTKQMKNIAQSIGVNFQFGSQVERIERLDRQLALHLAETSFHADAVVLAAGAGNLALLGSAAARLPLQEIQSYSATCNIRDFDEAPLASLTDEAFKTSITRFGNRIRIAGVAAPAAATSAVPPTAQRTLQRVGSDWFPNAANYNKPSLWSGVRLALPDGVPVLGQTTTRNLFVGIDDGANGWTGALGIGKILSDMISGQTPDIDVDGLTLSRYG